MLFRSGADETPEWEQIAETELRGKLTNQADRNPKAAWSEFVGRLIHGQGVGKDQAAEKYPLATAYVSKLGLFPEKNKGDLVQLLETIHTPIDGDEAQTDSAHSPTKAALATFARVGVRSLSWLHDNVDHVGHWAKSVLAKAPPAIRMPLTGMLAMTFAGHALANKAVYGVERMRGTEPETARRVANAVTGMDAMFGGKLLFLAGEVVHHDALLAFGTSLVMPVSPLAYLAVVSTSSMVKAMKAKAAVRKAKMSKESIGKDFSADSIPDLQESVETLTHHLERYGETHDAEQCDFWLGCFFAALEETQGDVEEACELADEASLEGEDQGEDLAQHEPEFSLDFEAPEVGFDFDVDQRGRESAGKAHPLVGNETEPTVYDLKKSKNRELVHQSEIEPYIEAALRNKEKKLPVFFTLADRAKNGEYHNPETGANFRMHGGPHFGINDERDGMSAWASENDFGTLKKIANGVKHSRGLWIPLMATSPLTYGSHGPEIVQAELRAAVENGETTHGKAMDWVNTKLKVKGLPRVKSLDEQIGRASCRERV